MASVVVDEQRIGAEVVNGHDVCVSRAVAMLQEQGLPDGLLPLKDIEEVGFVSSSGYFWVRQKKSCEHVFKLIKTKVFYDQEVSGYIQKQRLRKLNGVKAKELLLWVSITDIFNDDQHPGQTYFKSSAGLGRWHPTEAFLLEKQ